MWAANCLHPGLSTALVTMLHSTSSQNLKSVRLRYDAMKKELNYLLQPVMALYDRSSSNEIYQVQLGASKLFAEYENMSFTDAASGGLAKEVCLLGVRERGQGSIRLNPGKDYIMVASFCVIRSLVHIK